MSSLYHWKTLSNGIRIATASLPHAECSSFAIYLPTGSRHDPASLAGLAHFMEHMAFKGTAKRSARQLSLDLERTGAQANACTTEDHTVYDARGDASSLPLLAEILSDMVWHSSLPPREIALERDVIHEEITMYEETPSDHIGDLISQALWSPHSLGQPITGTHQTLDKINRNHLFSYCQQNHFRSDLIIAAAGPYSPMEFEKIVTPYLPTHTTEPSQKSRPFVAKKQPSHIVIRRDTEQLQLAIAHHTPGRHHEGRHALRLLSILLGESTSSRLFQKLREEKGLCYHVSSDLALFEETGSLEISLGLDPDSRNEAMEIIEREIHDLAHHGPTSAELDRAKKIAITSHKIALESTSAQMAWAAESLMFEGQIITPEESRARIMPVTQDQIRTIAQQIFQQDGRAIAEIRPE
ncbi:MAG: M16 family metallopeptidase [Akkermansiaceae bacterium]